jgi:tetratricopeptide (TPR) repeat protein
MTRLLKIAAIILAFLNLTCGVAVSHEFLGKADLQKMLFDISATSEAMIGFADELFESKEYYRAITEYKRYIHHFPDSPLALNAKYKIGLSYFKGGRYQQAEETFSNLSLLPEKNELTKKSLFKLADVYYKDSQYQMAVETYQRFVKEYPDAVEVHNAEYKLGWAYLFDNQYDQSQKSFDEISADSPFYAISANVSTEMDKREDMPHKSPGLAGTLSAVLPGAGQLYCGYYQDAATAFILNGVFIWGTVELFEDDHYGAGGVMAFFSLMWYSGNVFGAVNGAHKYNRNAENDFINKLDTKYNLSLKYNEQAKSNFLVFNMRF